MVSCPIASLNAPLLLFCPPSFGQGNNQDPLIIQAGTSQRFAQQVVSTASRKNGRLCEKHGRRRIRDAGHDDCNSETVTI
jgi:hypothetical protein